MIVEIRDIKKEEHLFLLDAAGRRDGVYYSSGGKGLREQIIVHVNGEEYKALIAGIMQRRRLLLWRNVPGTGYYAEAQVSTKGPGVWQSRDSAVLVIAALRQDDLERIHSRKYVRS